MSWIPPTDVVAIPSPANDVSSDPLTLYRATANWYVPELLVRPATTIFPSPWMATSNASSKPDPIEGRHDPSRAE